MTLRTNARVAGVTLLIYFAAGIGELIVSGRGPANPLLTMITSFSALVLGVTFYALTRREDPDLAMLILGCRLLEAVPGEGTIYFVVANLVFSWLVLRSRIVPVALARLGLFASAPFVVVLPMQRAGVFVGSLNWASGITWFMWLPLLVFELTLAAWLIVKGVHAPARKLAA